MESLLEKAIGLSPRYMQEFQCIGRDCEANCCSTPWTIYLDRKRYHKLKEALSHTREDRKLARGAFKRNRSADTNDLNYAKIVPADGKCVFQEADGLCAVQRRFGEGNLGQVCRTYPRMIRKTENRLEMTGTFSCPEVVRLCLFGDQAMDIVRFDPEGYNGNRFVCTHSPRGFADPYKNQQDNIRDIALFVLGDSRFSLQKRLFSLLYFAHRSKAFFYPKSADFTNSRLAREVDRISEGIYPDLWERNFASRELSMHLPMTVIQGLLAGCYTKAVTDFRELLDTVWGTYARIDETGRFLNLRITESNVSLECSKLLAHYQKRCRIFEEIFENRLDNCLSRYLQNLILKESYTEYRDLFAWAFDLVLRTALLRFLVISHPNFDPWLQNRVES